MDQAADLAVQNRRGQFDIASLRDGARRRHRKIAEAAVAGHALKHFLGNEKIETFEHLTVVAGPGSECRTDVQIGIENNLRRHRCSGERSDVRNWLGCGVVLHPSLTISRV